MTELARTARNVFLNWDVRAKYIGVSTLVFIVVAPFLMACQQVTSPTASTTTTGIARASGMSTSGTTSGTSTTPATTGLAPSGTNTLSTAPGCLFEKADTPVNVAFCDTFDAPAGTGNRSGQLNGAVWGVSRAGGSQNVGGPADGWFPTQVQACGQTVAAAPPNDVRICNGHLVESTTDGGDVTTLAMYPKQPFDIAGRTGTVSFDVSDNSQGIHAAWPELWYTDKPVSAPFTHEASWQAFPQNGVGVRFARACPAGQGPLCGPNCPGGNTSPVVSVDSAVVVNNYVGNDSFTNGNLQVIGDSCVKEPTQPGQLNHFELRISQQQIDVYGTDAGTTSPLKHLATIPHANLTLTKGLIWLEDVHYNGNKFNSQGTNTFAWDNVGFDGPVHAQDRTLDVLDNNTTNSDGSINLGWAIPPSGSRTLSTVSADQTSLTNANAALLTFNFWSEQVPDAFHFAINGHPHDYSWPYPYSLKFSPMTIAIPVPLSDIHTGTNTITLTAGAGYAINVFNVDLILVGGGGMPGSGGSATPTPGPTTTPTTPPNPAPTPAPIPVNNVPCTVTINGQQQTGTCSGMYTP